jgi:3-methyladenine DNA glycosylase AlkD
MNYKTIISRLKSQKNPKNIAGMVRFGINAKNTLGVNMPTIRIIAKEIGKDHDLAQELWDSKIHEARILAALIDEPALVTEKQMEKWVKGFDSWDVCDQTCMSLFNKTEFAWTKPYEWSKNKKEFVKRTAFALIAALASHDKKADDKKFTDFFPIIKREATDERNFVRKAVNWALRGIGKRNKNLCREALQIAREIQKENPDNRTAKWIAGDAIRELEKKSQLKKIS